jgi:L-ascorbate metabolism protein UlaG (beta-lactamase superfamily)
MQITWLGHGTFQFEWGSGKRLLADPWIEGNPRFPRGFAIDGVDLIIVTHGHFDHIHDAVPIAKKFQPQVAGIYELCHWLERKGVENTRAMNKGGTQYFFEGDDQVSVTMTHAVHSCGILEDDGSITYGGEAAGYVLRFADGRSIYFSGDTTAFTDMHLIKELYRPDLVFLPIGDLYTMGPREAAAACRLLDAKRLVPMHFGTFPALTGTPAALREILKGGDTELWELEPGKTVEW